MAASLALASVDAAPGNTIVLAGSGLTAGPNASVALQGQGVLTPASLPIAATFADDGTSVSFTVPDGVTTAPLVVTANDGTSAEIDLEVCSQYLQASQFVGEGIDTSGLAPGELDSVLRDASALVDSYLGGQTLRLLQVTEDHRFRESRKIWPYRRPLVSLDALSFITSNAIQTQFNVSGVTPDVYTNKTAGYFDVQAYAVGNAILLGAIQTLGFSANVWRAIYTAGYAYDKYPRALRKATSIIATEMLTYRNIQARGFGGLSKIKEGQVEYDRRNEEFAIPQPAIDLLKPLIPRSLR